MPDFPTDPRNKVRAESLADEGGCLLGALRLPFSPTMWARAAHLPLRRTLAPVFALTVVAAFVAGLFYGRRVVETIVWMGETYEKRGWSAVVISPEDEVWVAGEKPPRAASHGWLWAVDPDDDLTTERTKYESAIIVGRTTVTQYSGEWSQSYEVSEIAPHLRVFLPREDAASSITVDAAPATDRREVRIDGPFIRDVAEREGSAIRASILLLALALGTPLGWISALVYASVIGAVTARVAGRPRGLAFRQCFRVALATVSAKIFIDTAMMALGVDSPFDFVIHFPFILILTLSALARFPILDEDEAE